MNKALADLKTQIQFWTDEAHRTATVANEAFKRGDFEESKRMLTQTQTAITRLRWEAKAAGLLGYPMNLEESIQTAESELRGLMEITDHGSNS